MKFKVPGRNGVIAAITTVVVVLCLLFSYIYIQEDGDPLHLRDDPYIGDSIRIALVKEDVGGDPQSLEYEFIITHMDDEGITEVSLYIEGILQDTDTSVEEFMDMLRFDTGSTERIGSETVMFDGVGYECGVYIDDSGDTVYATDTGVILKRNMSGSDICGYLLSSSLLQEYPDSIFAVRYSFGQGEFIGLEITTGGEVRHLLVDILEEHEGYDDAVVVSYSGSEKDIEYVSLTEEVLYSLTFGDISGLEHAEPIGCCVERLTMGDVICVVLRNGDVTYHVGAFDNMIYGVYSPESSHRVIGLSLLYESTGGYDMSDVDDVSPGDVVVVSHSEFDRYVMDFDLDYFEVYMGTALSVEDGIVSYSQISLSDMRDSFESVSEDAFRSIADPSYHGDIAGFELVDTPMGTKLCLVSQQTVPISHISITVMCGVFDDVEYSTVVITPTGASMEYLSSSDMVQSVDVRHTNPGFFVMMENVFADGTTTYSLNSAVGLDGMHMLVSVEGEQHIFIPVNESDPHVVVGTETIETAIGTYECEILEYDLGDVIMRAWCTDSLPVSLRTEWFDGNGDPMMTSEVVMMSGHIGSIPGILG